MQKGEELKAILGYILVGLGYWRLNTLGKGRGREGVQLVEYVLSTREAMNSVPGTS